MADTRGAPGPPLPVGASADPAQNAWTVRSAAASWVTDDREPYQWEVLGEHLLASSVPPRVLGYTQQTISTLENTDEHSISDPHGGVWSGVDGARKVLQDAHRFLDPDRWPVNWARVSFPKQYEREKEFFEKTGRLDGTPTGVYVQAEGLLSNKGPRRRPNSAISESEWYEAMESTVAYARSWRGRAIPTEGGDRVSSYTPEAMVARMDSFDAARYKGWPSFGSGLNEKEVAACAYLASLIRGGRLSLTEMQGMVDQAAGSIALPACCVLFSRLQGGRKPIRAYVYSPSERGPVARADYDGCYPRWRGVFAVNMTYNLSMRPGTGYLTGLLRMTPHVQVRPARVGAYLQTVIRKSGRPWSDINEADETNFDLYQDTPQLRAALRILAKYDPPAAEVYMSMVHHPVLSPRYDPSAGAFMLHKDRAVLSGMTPTSLVDTLINLAQHIICFARFWNVDYDTAWARVGAMDDCLVVCMGDDTLVILPRGMTSRHYEDFFTKEVGAVMKVSEGSTFLSTTYAPDGRTCKILTRMSANYLFRERRFVPTNPLVVAVGVIVRKDLLEGHVYPQAFTNLATATLSGEAAYWGLRGTMNDVPALIERARAEAITPDDIASLGDIAYRITGGGDPTSPEELDMMSTEDVNAVLAAMAAGKGVRRSYIKKVQEGRSLFPGPQEAVNFLVDISTQRPVRRG